MKSAHAAQLVSNVIDTGIVSLAAIAAVAGAVGGCGAAGLMVLGSKSEVRLIQFFAYMSIGLIAGMLTFIFGEMLEIDVYDARELLKWSLGIGISVPVALFSKNLAITAMLKKFGWEVQFTIRRKEEDRRQTDKGK